jgi:2-phospho-L-lactate guanylyltransferase
MSRAHSTRRRRPASRGRFGALVVDWNDEVVGDRRWVLVVPVKRLAAAKTRLGPPYDQHRRELALAFAVDTTAAALACPLVSAVQVVTDEPLAAERLAATGAQVTGDDPDAGLNPALVHGATLAAATHRGASVGTLAADLPALRPDELTELLRTATAHPRCFVRDAAGSGTTVLLARTVGLLAPEFGPRSAARHAASGAVEVGAGLGSLRRDVDTAADLAAAVRLGVGPATARALAGLPDPAAQG